MTLNKNTRGIVMMILAVALLTTMGMLVKLIDTKYHPTQISFLRNLVAVAIIFPLLLRSGGLAILKTRRSGLHIIRSLTGVTGNILFFYSFQKLPVSEVVVISQAVPLFVSLLAVLLLGERVGWRRWAAISIGFLGVIIAMDPSGGIQAASLFAVSATAFWACTILLMRRLGTTESPYTIAFYFMVIGSIVTGMVQPWVWVTPTLPTLGLLIGVGVCGALGQILMAYALKLAEASVVSPFNYTGILWGIIFDIMIWNVLPTWTTLIGAGVITSTGIYIFYREARVRRK